MLWFASSAAATLASLAVACSSAHASTADDIAAELTSESVRGTGVSWALTNQGKQVFYPSSFEGEWAVSARLKDVSFPFGMSLMTKEVPGVTKNSMIAALPDVGAGMETPVSFRVRFVPSKGGVIADRASNQKALLDSFLGYAATQGVEYDPEKNPTRMSITYETQRRDQSKQSSDARKAELFINNRRYEARGDEFFAAETFRQVNQAKQSGFVYDYEVLHRYYVKDSTHMTADMRAAAFLVPESPGYFKANGRAVALYNYALEFDRL